MKDEQIAERLLFPLWKGASKSLKEKYKSDSWGMFENFITSAACNATLAEFFQKITRLMKIDVRSSDKEIVLQVIQSGEDYETLQAIRTKSGYLTLLTRALNEKRKETLKK